MGLCLPLSIRAEQKLSWKTKEPRGLDGTPATVESRSTWLIAANAWQRSSLSSSHGARTHWKEVKSTRLSGMQRREAGMQASRKEVRFIPVPPKSMDQTWRTLEPPNYLGRVFKTLQNRTAITVAWKSISFSNNSPEIEGLNSLVGMSHSPHPCRGRTQARKMEMGRPLFIEVLTHGTTI